MKMKEILSPPLVSLVILWLLSRETGVKAAEDGHLLTEVDMKLRLLNKPAVKTIESEDGDVIDCVNIYKQPAFDHPALKNHKIQMAPTFAAPSEVNSSESNNSFCETITISQTWQKSGSCPRGTIPILRVKREEISRASSLSQFGKKTHHIYPSLNDSDSKSDNHPLNLGPIANRSTAVVVATGYNFIGIQGDINVWNPRVESPSPDYSNAQLWLISGPGYAFESVESGWTVNPSLFGDSRTRFFIYWTTDSYKSSGCFNLLCAGFVQTSSRVTLGGAIEPISSTMGPQYVIKLQISLDPYTGHWWLLYGDFVVGYWPVQLFTYLSHSAIIAQWGGEVYSPNVKRSPHTRTAMGSGSWASGLRGSACYITNIRIIDNSKQLKYPEILGTYGDEYDCYSLVQYRYGYRSEPLVFFGGPGRSRMCP